jgi:fission process protein 1
MTVDTSKDPVHEENLPPGARWMAYAGRLRALLAAGRYMAYTSDVGEAFRPVVPPAVVTAAYAASFAYVGADVLVEGWHSVGRGDALGGPDGTARRVLERATFQGLASLAVPAVTIHGVVHATQRALDGWWDRRHAFKRPEGPAAASLPPHHGWAGHRVLRWAPSAAGLAVIPLLPLVDEPIEHGVASLANAVFGAPTLPPHASSLPPA